jgi:hypothetical protein
VAASSPPIAGKPALEQRLGLCFSTVVTLAAAHPCTIGAKMSPTLAYWILIGSYAAVVLALIAFWG